MTPPERKCGQAQTERLLPPRVIEIRPATLAKPELIRVRLCEGSSFREVKRLLREQRSHTLCNEALHQKAGSLKKPKLSN